MQRCAHDRITFDNVLWKMNNIKGYVVEKQGLHGALRSGVAADAAPPRCPPLALAGARTVAQLAG